MNEEETDTALEFINECMETSEIAERQRLLHGIWFVEAFRYVDHSGVFLWLKGLHGYEYFEITPETNIREELAQAVEWAKARAVLQQL